MTEVKLINEKIAAKQPDVFYKQYELFVNSAEKISDRRNSANQFYLTLNTAILSISGYLSVIQKEYFVTSLILVAAILANLCGQSIIDSYKSLNSAKFKVIHELENRLPANLYAYEWKILEKGETKKHKPFTHIERRIPQIFAIAYSIILLTIIFPIGVTFVISLFK